MSAPTPDPQAIAAARADTRATDDCVRRRFGVEPVDDPSGMLQPSEPLPADADEDAQFAAVMARYYPGSAG